MNIYIRIFVVGLGLLILLGTSCQIPTPNQDRGVPYLTFSIDSTQLDTLYQNQAIGFAFCPPKNWSAIDTAHNKQVKEIFMETGLKEHHEYIQQAFWDGENQNLGFLYIYPNATDSLLAAMIEEPDTFFNYHQEWATVQVAPFKTADFFIYQFLMLNEERVYFSLLFIEPTEQVFRMDYLMAKDYYQKHIRAIESSIGSFHLLTP